jgi:hypothetical protein
MSASSQNSMMTTGCQGQARRGRLVGRAVHTVSEAASRLTGHCWYRAIDEDYRLAR